MVTLFRKVQQKGVNFFTSHKFMIRAFSSPRQLDLGVIRNELEKYAGGAVDLEMNDQTGIAVMTLNNPKKLNCMTGSMMVEMADHVTQLESWSKGKGLIIMGAGGNFCSGGDIMFVRKAQHYGDEIATFQNDTLTRLLNLNLISASLLQGYALGGGAELSTASDFRVMSPSAKVGFVQIKMGLTTAWGATTRLVHMLGRQKTISLLSSAKVLTAEEAQTEGLVDHVFSYSLTPDEELGECKKWLLSNYCKHDADLIQDVKHLVVYSDINRDMKVSLNYERQVFGRYWGGPAQKAVLASKIKHI